MYSLVGLSIMAQPGSCGVFLGSSLPPPERKTPVSTCVISLCERSLESLLSRFFFLVSSMLRSTLFASAWCELLPLPKLATNQENQLGDPPALHVAWASASRHTRVTNHTTTSPEAAVCFRGQLRGITAREVSHVEEMVLSRLFLSGDVFAVVPAEECETAVGIYGEWEKETRGRAVRAWQLRQVICTPNSLTPQEAKFASALGPPIGYSAKQNLAIEMRHLKICGEATRTSNRLGRPYTWILLIRPDFTWCLSPERSMLGSYLLIPRETENEWFIGGSTEAALGPAELIWEYSKWYDTMVRNEAW